jgi:sulfite oxidase
MFNIRRLLAPTTLSISSIGYLQFKNYKDDKQQDKNNIYTEEEVSKHNSPNDAWVTYKNKVYNVTNFLDIHPGGKENLLMAIGGPVDMYWNIYKQHYSDYVSKVLSKYEIGELKDYQKEEFENEYHSEPTRDNTTTTVHKKEPYNAELNVANILDSFITPEKSWFTRNHHPVPDINIKHYRLIINGKLYKYDDIIASKNSEITTTIQCAGNRRSELNEIDKTMGLPWKGGAISTGKWRGVWLSDIVEIPKDKKYINLYDYDSNFSVSVPIDQPLFLAFNMNDEVLTRDRGYPLRVIAPGLTGSKNVKWIQEISFSNEEAESPWQTGIAYKIMPNFVKSTADIVPELKNILPTITTLPIQSYICEKEIDEDKKFVTLKGYAMASKDKKILKVEVSDDGGKTWKMSNIYKGKHEKNVWCFWKITLTYNPKTKYICRATDYDGTTQEHTAEQLWNIRGIANNSVL